MSNRSNQRTARVSGELDDRLDVFAADYGMNDAQANRRAMDEGLRARGYYPNDTLPETKLRHILRQVSVGLGFSGLTLISLTLFTSVEYRIIGFLLVVTALLVRGLERLIGRYEPYVSNRLTPGRTPDTRRKKA